IVVAAALVAAAIGAAVAVVLTRRTAQVANQEPVSAANSGDHAHVEGGHSIDIDQIGRVLAVLPAASILVDSNTGRVLSASEQAYTLALVRDGRISAFELSRMVSQVRTNGVAIHQEISLRRLPLAGGAVEIVARVAMVTESVVLVLVENLTGARRLDEVRRDFVANVGHELKTPVGALSLLAEAVLSAADDPEAVRHFAGRMQVESMRLAHLVADLVDLSRLQGQNPMEYAEPTSVDHVVGEAIDAIRMAAEAAEIEVVVTGTAGLTVLGVESQLVTAVRNLLANAVAYSPQLTRVVVAVALAADDIVEVTVTDQGIGIPANEIDRIFERFYRVDQARSRATGGTGLGLSIVKHVTRNHGGDVSVWSVEGEGSTFTLRLPEYRPQHSRSSRMGLATEGDKVK
ncbi:MAG: ATP-binding protein, partial [Actinomycetes bacterium]